MGQGIRIRQSSIMGSVEHSQSMAGAGVKAAAVDEEEWANRMYIKGAKQRLIEYLNSHDKDKVGEIFAMIIESCHDLVPPEEMRPVLERIINNYVTDYCSAMHITIGLNAIREILLRMPLALDEA